MRLSVAELARYRTSMRMIGRDASDAVAAAIESSDARGVTAMRQVAIDAIAQSVGIHGEMAQALAGQLFDEVCAADGIEVTGFELYDDIIDHALLEEKVRYYAIKAVNGDVAGFVDDSSHLAEWYAWRCNRTAMVRNCERNGVRYARVPTSGNPCDYCVMLASRGFVYHSSDSAEAGGHEHCCCVVVPGGESTSIEGYDPDAYYTAWKDSGFMPSASKSGGSRTAARFMANDVRGMQAKIDAVKSIDELRRLVDDANSQFGGRMSDRQRNGMQWAINRAMTKLRNKMLS